MAHHARIFKMLCVLAGLVFVACSMPASARDRPLERDLRRHITILASDDFGGRQPGTDGEAKTVAYLIEQWRNAGLVSGTNVPASDWTSPVELVSRRPLESRASFSRNGRMVTLPQAGLLVSTEATRSLVENASMLFVGRRVPSLAASQRQLAGKIAVMLDSDPDEYAAGMADSEARAEALIDAGAIAVLTVLDGGRALDDLEALRTTASYRLAGTTFSSRLEAFATPEFARALFRAGGRDYDAALRRAASVNFVPIDLRVSATLDASTQDSKLSSSNVIGKIAGRKPDGGAVLLLAHWDHFGTCRNPPAEDLVCNGAVDNASGLAVITEVARRVARSGGVDRDVYVLATTAEELGLLGATAFAENPPLPLENIIAAFNVDSVAVAPRRSAVGVVGRGMTRLDPAIDAVARQMRRRMVTSDEANFLLRRQDGWALLEHNVPTVMVSSAYGDLDRLQRFMDDRYHRTSDEADNRLELGGAAEDVELLVNLVRHFATAPSAR